MRLNVVSLYIRRKPYIPPDGSRGYSLEKSMAIMESQASDEEFRALADAVIDNNHSQECTAAQVRELLHGREGIDT